MGDVKRKWDILSKEQRDSVAKNIIYYFKNEREQEIGIIAAEEILDFFLKELS